MVKDAIHNSLSHRLIPEPFLLFRMSVNDIPLIDPFHRSSLLDSLTRSLPPLSSNILADFELFWAFDASALDDCVKDED
jgi:hypothetical protein